MLNSTNPDSFSSLRHLLKGTVTFLAIVLAVAACSSSDDVTTATDAPAAAEETAAPAAEESTTEAVEAPEAEESSAETTGTTFIAEVWADNWFALSVNGELVGEDSVPITTERSFNAEIIEFEATYPLTIAIEAKDFKETDSGIEYIGEGKQQMGDGGLIVQFTDLTTGQIVAVTDAGWSTLVVHQAPLNTSCEKDADPDATCEFLITETPSDWTSPSFDDSSWTAATEWSEDAVSPKDGYDEITWDPAAALVWGADLEVDNTVLLRSVVAG